LTVLGLISRLVMETGLAVARVTSRALRRRRGCMVAGKWLGKSIDLLLEKMRSVVRSS
jgi:hypothetical protein